MLRYDKGSLDGVALISSKQFSDDRGFFCELYRKDEFSDHKLDYHFVQDNLSSSRAGVIRGLHFQFPRAQGKLIRVCIGKLFDVAVDLRVASPSFGKHMAVLLNPGDQLYVPEGFAHGFLSLAVESIIQYRCTEYYYPDQQYTLQWNDPTLAINWPLEQVSHWYLGRNAKIPILSEKDDRGLSLVKTKELLESFHYGY